MASPRKKERPKLSFNLPCVPLRDMVVFPHVLVPLVLGRTASIGSIEKAQDYNQRVLLCTQRDSKVERPRLSHLYKTGIVARIVETTPMQEGTWKILVSGEQRVQPVRLINHNEDWLEAEVVLPREMPLSGNSLQEAEGLRRAVISEFERYAGLSQRISPEVLHEVTHVEDLDAFTDQVAAYSVTQLTERQRLLDTCSVLDRLQALLRYLMQENELLSMGMAARERVRQQIERAQREHYLHEQMRIIQEELGVRDEGGEDAAELYTLLERQKLPREVKERIERELVRYQRMPPFTPESAMLRTYIEWLLELPWSKATKDNMDLAHARRILDADHFGLEKVKERILEFLAVRKLSPHSKGPILCLVGPPGVGKTSLGASIARAMRRKFVRVSLGGIRDEAEIRGHRRTYVGALPGRILQSMKKAGVRNPVFMLDEIDKMSTDFRGDPASALLEVLDPAQNKQFSDHYVEVDFDLSDVFFIATANNEFDIPYALHDRMEIVRLPGYTLSEKAHIARLYLLPRQIKAAGLRKNQLLITDEALDFLIQRYTREAGVRELERNIAMLCRKLARMRVEGEIQKGLEVTPDTLPELLGPPPYSGISGDIAPQVGVAVGLAWTQAGGDILLIETSVMKGKGVLTLTGQLGEVMKESARAAFAYLRANAPALGLSENFYSKLDVHVHIPEGAIPKDGPSAGVALIVSMFSALSGKAPSHPVAMTGEITLRGRVLGVGGIKEKVIAAHRSGVGHVILPTENQKDIPEIPPEVRDSVRFSWVSHLDEVFSLVFGSATE